jgi:hypothetical protein
MRFTASAFLGLAVLLGGGGAWGQDQSPTQMTPEEKEAWDYFYLEEVLQRSCDDPTLRSAIALPQPKLTLETSAEGTTKVKAHVGVEVQKQLVFDLVVTSPISSSGETTLADLNGLSTGSTAKLGFSYFGAPWKSGAYKEALEKIDRVITDVLDKAKRIIDGPKTPKGKLAEIRTITSTNPDDDKEALEEIQRMAADPGDDKDGTKAQSEVDAIKKILEKKTRDGKWSMKDYLNPVISRPSAVAALGQKKYDETLRIWQDHMKHRVWVSNLDVTAEQKEFQVGNTPSASQPAPAKESHTDFQLTASEGAYFMGRFYASLNYSRGTKFKATQTGSPPKSQTAETLEFEIRRLFGSFGGGGHLTRDLQAKITTVEIPFYFLSKMGSSDMELNGGVAVRWQSDTKKFSIIAFIGPALSKVLRMPGASTQN